MSEVGQLLLKPDEAAAALRISRAKLYTLLTGGQLRSVRIGGSRRIPVEALREFVSRQLAEQEANHASA